MSELTTVLYVEDDADIRAVTEFALDDEGFELIICPGGQEALDRASHQSIDLFLLDVMMPGMDGPTTLEKLREFPELKTTPVIFMTAKVQSAELEQYKALGALGVINKPFDPMTLPEQIRNLLEK
jgi:CheY-like chemotaxis protein